MAHILVQAAKERGEGKGGRRIIVIMPGGSITSRRRRQRSGHAHCSGSVYVQMMSTQDCPPYPPLRSACNNTEEKEGKEQKMYAAEANNQGK